MNEELNYYRKKIAIAIFVFLLGIVVALAGGKGKLTFFEVLFVGVSFLGYYWGWDIIKRGFPALVGGSIMEIFAPGAFIAGFMFFGIWALVGFWVGLIKGGYDFVLTIAAYRRAITDYRTATQTASAYQQAPAAGAVVQASFADREPEQSAGAGQKKDLSDISNWDL